MKKLLIILTITLLFVGLHAQESTTASGGEASGDEGTVSYSVGQVVYGTHSGTTGSVSEGIQQPYAISVIIGLEETGINLNISAFPNPTTDYLILKIADDAHQESRFTITLYDLILILSANHTNWIVKYI